MLNEKYETNTMHVWWADLSLQGFLWPERRESRRPDSCKTKAPECSDERNLDERFSHCIELVFIHKSSLWVLLLVNYSRGKGALLLSRALSDQHWKVEITLASAIKYELLLFSEKRPAILNGTIGKCTIHVSSRSNKNYFCRVFFQNALYTTLHDSFETCLHSSHPNEIVAVAGC